MAADRTAMEQDLQRNLAEVANAGYLLAYAGGSLLAMAWLTDGQGVDDALAVREQLKAQGMADWNLQTAAFGAHIREETACWAKVIKTRNITME